LYETGFTAAELGELGAFYRSQLGQKAVRAHDGIAQNLSSIVLVLFATREGMAVVRAGLVELQDKGLNMGPLRP
jgi:hypothetical protein